VPPREAEQIGPDLPPLLLERYSRLVGEYSKGQLDRNLIHNIKLRNDVSSRVSMIRNNL